MEHISNLINTSSLSVKREENKFSTTLDPHVTEVVNKLFVLFYSLCRGFEKQYQDRKRLNVEKTQWIRAFMDIGFDSLEKVQLGIKKCRLESPINTPTIGQFVKWCTPMPEELGLPSVEKSYAEACSNSSPSNQKKMWTHQAIYHAWTMCNSYELANLPRKNTFPVFERNYNIAAKMMIRGEALKSIPATLPYSHEFKANRKLIKGFEHCNSYETAKAEMERILGKKINGPTHQERMQKNSKQFGI